MPGMKGPNPDDSAGFPAGAADRDLRLRLEATTHLDVEAGLQSLRGKVASYARLLRKYVATHGNDMGAIRGSLLAGNLAEARRLAHSLKSASGTLGAREIQARAAELESALAEALREGQLEPRQVEPLIAAIESSWTPLAHSLTEVLGAGDPPERSL